MKYLFTDEGLQALRSFMQPGTLVALDYDGTLAELAADPARARMRPETRDLLARVARRYRTLVLTGRSRQDVLRLLGTAADLEVIGNHGIETSRSHSSEFRDRVAEWRKLLREELRAMEGIAIEDKTHSLSVHYRLAPHPDRAESAIRQAASRLAGARLVGGKCVLNIVPQHAPHKGSALLTEIERTASPRSIFVGDDVTDEDVFALDRPQQVLSIRVGQHDDSSAAFFLRTQHEVDALLTRLAQS